MSDRPTDIAKESFGRAEMKSYKAQNSFSTLKGGNTPTPLSDHEWGDVHLASALHDIARGLRHLSAGPRATYVLLEQINAKLPR